MGPAAEQYDRERRNRARDMRRRMHAAHSPMTRRRRANLKEPPGRGIPKAMPLPDSGGKALVSFGRTGCIYGFPLPPPAPLFPAIRAGRRFATSVCRLRHNQMGQGPTEPHWTQYVPTEFWWCCAVQTINDTRNERLELMKAGRSWSSVAGPHQTLGGSNSRKVTPGGG